MLKKSPTPLKKKLAPVKKKLKIKAPRIANRGGYQVQDTWFHKAKAAGYRARSAFKLIQLEEAMHIINPGMSVIDLGCAPGSWMQVLVHAVGENGQVLGIDLQEVKKFAQKNITTLVGDMTHLETHIAIKKYFSDMGLSRCDLITSDVAPNTTGRNDDDQYNSSMLCLEVIKIADKFLAPGGNLVMKIFVGRDLNRVLDQAKNKFKIVKCIKPEACRDRSFEEYVVCKGYRG